MKTDPIGTATALGLDSYLRGAGPHLTSETSPLHPFTLVVAARTEGILPTTQRVRRFFGQRDLASAWQGAFIIARDAGDERWRNPVIATTARIQLVALSDLATRRADETSQAAAWIGDELAGPVVADWELLAGVADLSLMEMGDIAARERVRLRAISQMQHAVDGHSYVQAVLGLSVTTYTNWRPGSGCMCALATALSAGEGVLESVPLMDEIPEAEPAWAAEARKKAERDKAERERIARGPSLTVLVSVDHLPGVAKDGEKATGKSVSMQVRGEWAPFAGRSWPLQPVGDLVAARAVLVGEFPHAERVVDMVLRDLVGRSHVFVKPMLIVGPAGCGKTRLARRIGEVLGLGVQVLPCAGIADSAALGTSRQWATARACLPLQLLKRFGAASALMVWDELEKAGSGKQNGNLQDGLLPLLNLQDASRFFDPMVECQVDLSGVSHIATANSLDGMGEALKDRFRIVHMPEPKPAHLPALAVGVMAEIRAERGQDEQWLPDITPDEIEVVQAVWTGGSVRLLKRILEAMVATRESTATRN